MPSALLERRPDISIAERQAQAANAQVGIAIAAYYPNVTLTGSGGWRARASRHRFQGPSRHSLWAIGVHRRRADLRRRTVATPSPIRPGTTTNRSADNYRESVLNAFQEIEKITSPR